MSDKIQFTCPHCSHQMQLPSSTVGKQGKCPGCGEVVTISAPVSQTPLSPSHQSNDPLGPSPGPLQPTPDPLPASQDQESASQLSPEQKDVDAGRASNKKPFLIGAGVGSGLGVMVTALLFMILGGNDSKPTSDGEDKPTTNATSDVDSQQVDSNSGAQNSPAVRPVAPEGSTAAINMSSPEAVAETVFNALKNNDKDAFYSIMPSASVFHTFVEEQIAVENDPDRRKWLSDQLNSTETNERQREKTGSDFDDFRERVDFSQASLVSAVSDLDPDEPEYYRDFGKIQMCRLVLLFFEVGDVLYVGKLETLFKIDGSWYLFRDEIFGSGRGFGPAANVTSDTRWLPEMRQVLGRQRSVAAARILRALPEPAAP